MSKDHETVSPDPHGPAPVAGALVHRTVTEADESVSVVVVEALAEAKGISPLDIEEPLYAAVDPDALDALFDAGGTVLTDGRIQFTAAGYEVTVTTRGDVTVRVA